MSERETMEYHGIRESKQCVSERVGGQISERETMEYKREQTMRVIERERVREMKE